MYVDSSNQTTQSQPIQVQARLLKLDEVRALTKMSKASIYDKIKKNEFPKQIKVGDRSVCWVESEVVSWINEKIDLSRLNG